MKTEKIEKLLVTNGFKITLKKFTHFGLEVTFVAKNLGKVFLTLSGKCNKCYYLLQTLVQTCKAWMILYMLIL